MKLHFHRPALATAFGIVGGVVPSRTTREVLKNLKLTAEGETASLAGSDGEVSIQYNIADVRIEEPGEALLPESRVAQILRELTEPEVRIEVSSDKLLIQSGHSEFRLNPENPVDFPLVTTFAEESYYTIKGGLLKEAIRRTLFATDVESTRYALGGILVEPHSHGLTLAATDSRRLAVMEIACEKHGDPAASAGTNTTVIPSKAMNLIERSLAGVEDEDVKLALRGNDVLVCSGNSTISSVLVSGRFPNYRQVIPESSPIEIQMVVGPFYTAVRQAQIVTSDESRGVDFSFADGTLTLASKAADVGVSKVQLPISYDGEPLSITFDPKYVAEFLRVLDSQTPITLHLIDAGRQATFRVEGGYTYVVMPVTRDREA